MKRKNYTDNDIIVLIRAYENHKLTIQEVCEKFGVTKGSFRLWLKKLGLECRSDMPRGFRHDWGRIRSLVVDNLVGVKNDNKVTG